MSTDPADARGDDRESLLRPVDPDQWAAVVDIEDDVELARLARYLHERPDGQAGITTLAERLNLSNHEVRALLAAASSRRREAQATALLADLVSRGVVAPAEAPKTAPPEPLVVPGGLSDLVLEQRA